jgi:hypothetical protein
MPRTATKASPSFSFPRFIIRKAVFATTALVSEDAGFPRSRLILPNLVLRLLPALNRSTVLASRLSSHFIGAVGDLRGNINHPLAHGVRNAPLDHRDLDGVVQAETGDHRINKDSERLPPRQGLESRETHESKGGARERIDCNGYQEGFAGQSRPESTALPRGYDGEYGKVKQQKKAEGIEGIVVGS